MYSAEVEQEPYDAEEFVERLAWRTSGTSTATGSSSGNSAVSVPAQARAQAEGALHLHDAFVQAIKDLTVMHEAQKKKCEVLEQVCPPDFCQLLGSLMLFMFIYARLEMSR
jgi:hypothetical protein